MRDVLVICSQVRHGREYIQSLRDRTIDNGRTAPLLEDYQIFSTSSHDPYNIRGHYYHKIVYLGPYLNVPRFKQDQLHNQLEYIKLRNPNAEEVYIRDWR